MREIKFRGIEIKSNKMVFGCLIHGVGSKAGKMYILPRQITYPEGCHDLNGWEVLPETVGEYVGLPDKNDKEIYEFDIVKCVANNDFKWPAKGFVEYLPSSAGFAINVGRQLLDNDNCYYAHFWSHIDFEVIGNIYEHSHLLNSQA